MPALRKLCILACLALPAVAGAQASGDERTTAYHDFRTVFDHGDYKAALPLATHVVELTRSTYGAEAPENANALTNLATTYYRLKDYGNALDSYRSALKALDQVSDNADPRLVRPLHGMGVVLNAMDRQEEAIVPLKRAVDILRNRDGLRSATQLPVLRSLIAAYAASGRAEDAGREQDYALSVAESAYGKDDPRMLGPLDDAARWYEQTGRYTAARVLHTRAVQIADAAKPGGIEAVPGLRGIARCFRLAYMYGEAQESVDATAASLAQTPGEAAFNQIINAPSADGERALRNALQRLGTTPDQAALRGAVLMDLGDWYVAAQKRPRALDSWRQAWKEFATAGDTAPLQQPATSIYAPPPIAVSRRQKNPDDYAAQPVELRVAIDADGNLHDATVANPAPERESAEKAVLAAVKRAAWRPAFRDGQPVATDDFLFREMVYVKLPKSAG